ncbi:hypothetical protein OB919_17975 [Halobacteria archaeon AArc-curdl1]|uniref:Uncharacterized protein n=1 Tax=Natronosalvus hydrolyticus TaxID=2979988 RepID=A0AAP2ZB18_9EURY|nr:hypothetical protein [Halobacteria archaeon AArc-curdl1]
MDDRTDELTTAIKELTATLDELRVDLERGRTRPRPRFRPPTPEELATFGDEVAIPATIGILKLNIKALETLQRTLRASRRSKNLRDDADAVASRTRKHSSAIRETTLSHLDSALEELQDAISGGSLEADERTRDLLEDARRLRQEVDRRLERQSDSLRADESAAETHRIEITSEDTDSDTRDENEPATESNDTRVDVDVDAELETLKEQYSPADEEPSENDDTQGNDTDSSAVDEGDNDHDSSANDEGNDDRNSSANDEGNDDRNSSEGDNGENGERDDADDHRSNDDG